MAKQMATKQRPTPKKKTPARGGRPAGLFTWIAVGLVVVVVVALVIIKVASGGSTTPGKTTFQPVSSTVLTELTTVPASVFNAVGVTSPIAQVTPPQAIANLPGLTATNASGQKVPEVLYMGAEYCPYCAAQRWSTIVALSRFGTWSGLGNMSSASGDIYANTPTFTFAKSKYTSKYVAFKSVEMYTNYIDPKTSYYAVLQKPTSQEQHELSAYDTSKYIKGLESSQDGSIPFMSFANKFLVAGASYSPTTLTGSSRDEIAAALDNSTSPVTQAIIASANYQTAAICSVTNQQPGNVCSSAGVSAAAKAMGIK